jgi:hypothetical protein
LYADEDDFSLIAPFKRNYQVGLLLTINPIEI